MKPARVSNRVLGIEWDSTSVTVAVAVRNGGGGACERLARFDVPDGLEEPAARGAWLRSQLDGAGIAPGPAVAVLPRGSALWRRIPLPAGVGADRDAVVEFQARRELPLPLEEVHAAWVPDRTGDGATVGAVRRSSVQHWRATYEAAGCPLVGLVPGAIAALAAAGSSLHENERTSSLLLDLGPRESEISVILDGAPRLVRTTSVGSGHADLADRLAGEITRTQRAFASDAPDATPGRVWLTGGNGGTLAGDLGARCGMPVAPLAAPAGLQPPDPEPEPGWVAIGAAVTAFAPEGPRIDLLRPVIGAPRPRPSRIGRGVLFTAAAIALLALLIVPGYLLDLTEADTKRLIAEADRLEKGDVAQVQTLRQRAHLLQSWTSERAHWIEVVKALAESVPEDKDVYVESLNLREGYPLRATGAARTQAAIQEFVAALEAHDRFHDVAPKSQDHNPRRRGNHKWDFTIDARVRVDAAEPE